MNRLNKYLDDQKEAISRINLERVIEISEHLMQTATEGNNIWVAGNGGSATTAAHLVTDLTKGCYEKTKIQHPAICLNESLGAFSAWSNDYSYNDALSFELQSLGKIGDCFIAIS
jgi:D-sedoheptulose 7-phosphate isomerase